MDMKSPVRQMCRKTTFALIVLSLSSISTLSFSSQKVNSQELTPQTILSNVMPGDEWYQVVTMPASATTFSYDGSATNPADEIRAVDLTYFDNSDGCNSVPLGDGRQTITGGAFAISDGSTVSLNELSAYQVGNDSDKANISDMSTVGYIAVVFKSSSTADVPQSQFDTSNYQCIQVGCSGNSCTETGDLAPHRFTMRSEGNTEIGDFADGGVVACMNASTPDNNGYLIASTFDQGTGISWSNSDATTGADSTTNGTTNTAKIVASPSCTSESGCAALLCHNLSIAGGYDSDWFLPAGADNADAQLNCLYTNRAAIGGFDGNIYWSSTENSLVPTTTAWFRTFLTDFRNVTNKTGEFRVRCVRAFTPT